MKRLFNDGWEFTKQPLFTKIEEMLERQEAFAPVGLPHDWLIYQANDLYEDSTGWYRRVLDYKKQADEKIFLYFEGIYMDSHIYVNPRENSEAVFEWKYGYSSFEVELTPYLKAGKNEIWVSVDHQSPNTRWYSGAGIYRNVWLKTVHEKYIATDSIYFHAEKTDGDVWDIMISAEALGG
ncbi:MAG: glycoside hydrolase family 2, partial [Clostridiales bacterium]|nr:glycoside hydrolase family 2 [Candidatus Blautia equi]